MEKNICNICGGGYVYKNGKWICSCCDNVRQDEITNEEVILLANASTRLRMADFDGAEELYSDFVKKYPKNAEGYWGLLLSKYGIKYEDDFDGKKIPTVYATSIESVLNDENYKKALNLADKETEKYYKQQAVKFEAIRKEWVEKASKEEPVDIFICYKDSDADRDIARTDDSYEAQNLYTYLMSKGYKVFFSRESLRDKVSEKYEPYIFNALNTAHVMIVYGSSKEYLESTWVKNEWTRFLKKIKNKQKQENSLIVAFDKMKANELPKVFASVQCMNASQKTFYEDLDNHIQKVIKKATAPTTKLERVEVKENVKHKRAKKLDKDIVRREIGTYNVEQLTGDEETQLKTAYKFLSKALFSDADEIISRILEKNPRNGQAIIGKMLINLNAQSVEEIEQHITPETDFEEIENVISYSNKDFALQVLLSIKAACINEFRKLNCDFALKLLDFVFKYNIENDDFIKKLNIIFVQLVKRGELESAELLNNAILKSLVDDTDTYLEQLNKSINGLVAEREFEYANKYIDEYLEIHPTEQVMLWKKICNNLECQNDTELVDRIYLFNDNEVFEYLLECTTAGKERDYYIDKMISLIQTCAAKNNNANFEKCCELFEYVLKYTTQDKKYIQVIFDYASMCQNKGQFVFAEKYFAIVIGEDEKNHNAYWKLLQCKLKAKNNTELVEQPIIITTLPEFHSAIVAAGDDDKSVDRYIDLKAKQIAYIEKQKVLAEKRRKIKKTATICAIITAIILAIVIGFSSWNLYYTTNNKLLYTLNSSGDGYIVYAGRFYDETNIEIPRSYNGKPVVEIAENGFKDKKVQTISIPNTIRKIGNSAFYNCCSLEDVKFLDSGNIKDDNLSSAEIISFIYPIDNYQILKDYKANELQYNEILQQWEVHWCIDFASQTTNEVKAVYSGVISAVYSNALDGNVVELTINENLKVVYSALGSYEDYIFPGSRVEKGEVIGTTGSKQAHISSNNFVCLEVKKDGIKVNPHDYFNSSEKAQDKNQSLVYENQFETIGDYAFYNCLNLKEFKSLETLKTIGKYAFANCASLNGFEFPEKVTRIEEGTFCGAFSSSDSVTISIPSNIEFVGKNAFSNCTSIGIIEVSERDEIPQEWDAEWKGNSNTHVLWTMNVTFDYMGADDNCDVKKISVVTSYSYALPTPTKSGFSFGGWYSEKNGLGTQYAYANGSSVKVWDGESSIKVYAHWIANSNTIIFNGNGATSGTMENETIVTGGFKNLPNNIYIRDGYTFVGWATSSDGQVVYDDGDTYYMGAKPTNVLYAVWSANTNSLRFNGNGPDYGNDRIWNSMSNVSAKTDEVITLPKSSFLRNGYRFIGWSTTSNGNVEYSDGDTFKMPPSATTYLYAKWQAIDYTITLVLNGGNYDGETIITYNAETEPFTINEATRLGYTFVGWTQAESGGCYKTFTIQKGTMFNKTYTANWSANTNQVIFNGNGHTSGEMSNQSIKTDQKANLKNNQYVKDDYLFLGWSTTANGSVEYVNMAEYTMGPNSTYTLYAVWKLAPAQVVFNGNGHTSGSMETLTPERNTTINLPNNSFKRDGYNFIGWATTVDGEVVIENGGSFEVGLDAVYNLYAIWEIIKYTLNYDLCDGTDSVTSILAPGEPMNLPTPTRIGFIFKQWNRYHENGNVAEYPYNKTIMPSYDCYLRAVWETDFASTDEIIGIYTGDEFEKISTNVNGNYILLANIIVDSTTLSSVDFKGELDGNGFVISILTNLHSEQEGSIGFIGTNNGIIKNLKLSGCLNEYNENRYLYFYVSKGVNCGALVGYNYGSILNCVIDSNLIITKGNYTYADYAYTGMIAGVNEGTIMNCYSNGNISVHAEGAIRVGGIVGCNKGMIKYSYYAGDIITYIENSASVYIIYAGGLVGEADSDSVVTNSFMVGNITLRSQNSANNHCNKVIVGNTIGSYVDCFVLKGVVIRNEYGANLNYYEETAITDDGISYKVLNNLKTYAMVVSTVGFNAFVSKDDLKENENNVWIVNGNDYPKLYWED